MEQLAQAERDDADQEHDDQHRGPARDGQEEAQVDGEAGDEPEEHERARALRFGKRVELAQRHCRCGDDEDEEVHTAHDAQQQDERDRHDADGDALCEIGHG